MKLLLDSHAFLWFILDDKRLSERSKNLIAVAENVVFVSPGSLWEIAIKIRLGKYALPEPYESFMSSQLRMNDFSLLPILPRHTAFLTTMPLHHRDPFDRLIVAQAITEAMPLVSVDSCMDAYGVNRLW